MGNLVTREVPIVVVDSIQPNPHQMFADGQPLTFEKKESEGTTFTSLLLSQHSTIQVEHLRGRSFGPSHIACPHCLIVVRGQRVCLRSSLGLTTKRKSILVNAS